MPELPEVETTRRGIEPHILGAKVARVVVRNRHLRQPVPRALAAVLPGLQVAALARRGKYLLFDMGAGTIIVHLGMSGSLRLVDPGGPAGKHDHVDIEFTHGVCLRLCDPRRFGVMLWTRAAPLQHPLLRDLGPEPLAAEFDADYLYTETRGRRVAIKQLLMNARLVVGVGNIYASEALYLAGVHPQRAAGRIARTRCAAIVQAVRAVLTAAIEQGGTTLRDFYYGKDQPGYFGQSLRVYGRAGSPCQQCGAPIRQFNQGQRSTYYCPRCQR
jgi:formamidopyrimidine-DNA glycosylase